LLWIAHARPITAWFGQRNELRGCRLSSCVNQIRATFTGPGSPNPRAGAVCLAVHGIGNLLAPGGLYPSVGHRFCSSWAGQLEVIGTGRQLCASLAAHLPKPRRKTRPVAAMQVFGFVPVSARGLGRPIGERQWRTDRSSALQCGHFSRLGVVFVGEWLLCR
jgi:hypothetical protein